MAGNAGGDVVGGVGSIGICLDPHPPHPACSLLPGVLIAGICVHMCVACVCVMRCCHRAFSARPLWLESKSWNLSFLGLCVTI